MLFILLFLFQGGKESKASKGNHKSSRDSNHALIHDSPGSSLLDGFNGDVGVVEDIRMTDAIEDVLNVFL